MKDGLALVGISSAQLDRRGDGLLQRLRHQMPAVNVSRQRSDGTGHQRVEGVLNGNDALQGRLVALRRVLRRVYQRVERLAHALQRQHPLSRKRRGLKKSALLREWFDDVFAELLQRPAVDEAVNHLITDGIGHERHRSGCHAIEDSTLDVKWG